MTAERIVPMERRHIPSCRSITQLSEPWKTLKEGIDFSRFLKRKEAHVILEDGIIAGFIIFTSDPVFARGGYLRAVCVAPGFRHQGIGKKLLSFAERTTAGKARNFYLCVSSFNKRGQAFYKSLGYQRIGKIPGLVIPDQDELIFWKPLESAGSPSRRRPR